MTLEFEEFERIARFVRTAWSGAEGTGKDGKIVDLVRYRREQECLRQKAVGAEEMIDRPAKIRYTAEQKRNRAYIERLQATLQIGPTVRKTLAIREQIGLI